MHGKCKYKQLHMHYCKFRSHSNATSTCAEYLFFLLLFLTVIKIVVSKSKLVCKFLIFIWCKSYFLPYKYINFRHNLSIRLCNVYVVNVCLWPRQNVSDPDVSDPKLLDLDAEVYDQDISAPDPDQDISDQVISDLVLWGPFVCVENVCVRCIRDRNDQVRNSRVRNDMIRNVRVQNFWVRNDRVRNFVVWNDLVWNVWGRSVFVRNVRVRNLRVRVQRLSVQNVLVRNRDIFACVTFFIATELWKDCILGTLRPKRPSHKRGHLCMCIIFRR